MPFWTFIIRACKDSEILERLKVKHSSLTAGGFFPWSGISTPDEFSDTKIRRVGTASNGVFPLPHLSSVPCTLRKKRHRKNHPGVRSRKASNQREKISSAAMAYKLKDRKEKMLYKGSVYELTLQWDREGLQQVLLRYASFLCTHPEGRRQLCTNRLLFQWGRF